MDNPENYTSAVDQGEGQEMDPKVAKQLESYVMILMNIIHGKESAGMVMDVLKSGADEEGAEADPFNTVPQAAMAINDMALQITSSEGIDINFSTQLGGSAYLIPDLLELGVAANLWEELSEEDVAAVFEDTLEMVITRGLKDGSIDPIQLQLDVEPLMSKNQKSAGDAFASELGLESEPSQQAMSDQHANSRVRKAEAMSTKQQAQKKAAEANQAVDQQAQGPTPQQAQALQGGQQ